LTRIINYTLPCPPLPLTDFLRFGAGMPRFYFESSQSSRAIAGLGIAAQTFGAGENRFAALGAELENFFSQVRLLNPAESLPQPVALAGGSFFSNMRPGEWESFPAAALILPRYTLTRLGGETFFALNQPAAAGESLADAAQRLRLEADSFLRRLRAASFSPPPAPDFSFEETSRTDWEDLLRRAIAQIDADALQKVVLARPGRAAGGAVDVPALLAHLGETCPACFRFLFEFLHGAAFAGTTPERLVSVTGAKFVTAAVAGSIRRGAAAEEDAALGAALLASAKDNREQTFVLDEIRAKMLPLAEQLTFDATPRLLRLPNIQHLQTGIAGKLRAGQSALSIVQALHPTPAVGGVPGAAALKFIRAAEGFERGWYAAPLGWVNAAGDGDFAVAIRSGLFDENGATLFGGAGIVADSEPQKEWDETGLKMRFLLDALQAVTA